jgi:DHA1 family multidrug resistance protein-like MFS transporter
MSAGLARETLPTVVDFRALRRNQDITVVMVFVVFLCLAIVLPFLPLYVRQLGVGDAQDVALWAGALIGAPPLFASLFAPLWGRLADRFGHKPMALRGLASYVLLLVLSAAVRSPLELLVLRAGIGAFGAVGPMGLAMATSYAPSDLTGRAVGMIQSAQILSTGVGPLLGGLLADHIGTRSTFLATSLLCLLTLLLVSAFYREPPVRAAFGVHGRRLSLRALASRPHIPMVLASLALVGFVGRSFTPTLPFHLEQIGLPAERLGFSSGLLLSAHSLACALSASVLGGLARRFAPERLLAGSLFAGALAVLPMAFAKSLFALAALAVLLGLASGGALTLCYTIGAMNVPEDSRASAFGLFAGAALLGQAVSPAVAGLLARIDVRAVYPLDAALSFALAGSLLVALRRPSLPRVAASRASAD